MLGGEAAIESVVEVGGRDGCFEREGGDLPKRVDAGVGAARALREHPLAHGAVDRVREQALDGGQAGLDLPSMERCAVVA